MYKLLLFYLLVIVGFPSFAQVKTETQNVVIVTLDGFRWQEVFRGADPVLISNKKYVRNTQRVQAFAARSPEERRFQLLPFFWGVIGGQGQLYGNRDRGNFVDCSNPYWFSYPGYSEMLVGAVDRSICSNLKVENQNTTVLDFLNGQPGLCRSVAAFSTWDVIPYILGHRTPGFPVNCDEGETNPGNQERITCSDSLTFLHAMNYLSCHRPRILYIAFDGTDHFAHLDRYDDYLSAAHQTDQWIAQLWEWVQADPSYKDNTTLLITTDHGRGQNSKKSWRHHGRFTRGSGQIWIAAIGPDTPGEGEFTMKGQIYQRQLAKSIAALVGLNYENKLTVGEAIPTLMRQAEFIAESSSASSLANK